MSSGSLHGGGVGSRSVKQKNDFNEEGTEFGIAGCGINCSGSEVEVMHSSVDIEEGYVRVEFGATAVCLNSMGDRGFGIQEQG
jgi:hypothetical protein